MADLVTLQDTFIAGVRRDNARDQVPKGGLWWSQDVLPNIDARLRERGGYTNASDAITGVFAGADLINTGVFAPFTAGSQNLTIAEDSGVQARLVKIAANGTCTDIGAVATAVRTLLPFHRNIVVIPFNDGTTAPQKYNGSAISSLGGSPPAGRYGTVFNDRTILAASSANPNRIWFSDPGDPEGWDTVNSFWDFSFPITGIATLKNVILVFHEAYTARLIGSTPPPDGDFRADDPMFNVGCNDTLSIATWNDRIVFANAGGVYVTDGAAVDDLTARCGMTKYWQETMLGYDSGWRIAGGILRDHYFVFVMNGTTLKLGAMIDLRRYAYWPLTNIDAFAMWVGQGASDELYFGRRGQARVGSLSSLFIPASGVKNDGNGTAVTGLVETPFYRGKPTDKGWRRLFVTQYVKDYASDNPTVAVSYVKTQEATSYTPLGSYAEGTTEDRKPMTMGFSGRGVGLKLARANAGDWWLDQLEADVNSREGSR